MFIAGDAFIISTSCLIAPSISLPKTGEGIKALFDKVVAVFEGHDDTVRHIHVNLGNDIEGAIRQLRTY